MRKLAIFTAGFAMAAAFFVYLVLDARALWFAGACLLLAVLVRAFDLRRITVLVLGIAAGLIWCMAYKQLWLAPADSLCRQEQTVTVVLTEDPVETTYGARAKGRVTVEKRTYDVFFYGPRDLLEADAGDRVTALVSAEPTGLDIRDGETLYQRSSGAVLRLFTKEDMTWNQGEPGWALRLRQNLTDRLQTLYTGEVEGLLRALITGDRSGMTYQMENDMAVAGLSHAIAVSGTHVVVLLSMIAFGCGYNPRLTALLGIPVILAFAVMTGASPSAMRSAMMQALVLGAPLVRREQDKVTTLSFAALVLLVENPWNIANVSFQLSFAAVVGLMLLAEPIRDRPLPKKKQAGRIQRFLASSVAASLAAIGATLPLTIFYFRTVSIVAIPMNILALWAVTAMFVLGLLSCALPVLAWPVTGLARYVLILSRWAAGIPYAAAYETFPPLMIWALLAYGALFWILFAKEPRTKAVLGLLAAGFLTCILWGNYDLVREGPVARVLDVGQGQTVLWNHGDFTAMVDCGGGYPEEAGELAVRTLHSGGRTDVDALVLTHYDEDHAGGIFQLFYRVRVGVLVLPDTKDRSGLKDRILEAAEAADCPVVFAEDVTELTYDGGSLTVFPPVSLEDDNNSGICVLARAGEYDMFISGDLDQFKEIRLCARYDLPQVELLLAGHHGAESSTGTYFLEQLRPRIVAISVGEENAYGHPAQGTLERIASIGADVYRTDLDGTLVLRGK